MSESVNMYLKLITQIKKLEKISSEMQGVFSVQDLRAIFFKSNDRAFYRTIATLEELNLIRKFINGFYLTENYNSEMLCARIDPNSYISMDTVLSQNGLVGTLPTRLITAIRIGRNRTYRSNEVVIKIFGITKELFFGFKKLNGINKADNEKAFIDTLYYYMKGNRNIFNPVSDLNLEQLDLKKCSKYLEYYKNRNFVSYCKGILNG